MSPIVYLLYFRDSTISTFRFKLYFSLTLIVERDINKRKVKPSSNPELVHLDYTEGGSSSDSDFCIEDHHVNSESDSDRDTDEDDENQEESDKDEDNIGFNNNMTACDKTIVTTSQADSKRVNLKEIMDKIHICSICLGDISDDVNELIDCDKCGISVHKGCYSAHDSGSFISSVSPCSMETWFCEACKAGIENPTCELCPNFGGIFKETDCGKWVHLVCALYIHGITFGEVSSCSKVLLFPNTSPRLCNKTCTLCEDVRFMCTGVTIKCDVGMCQSNFHVTCAQREGRLSKETSPKTDIQDPFYAHCILHVDKLVAKKRKRNWGALQLRSKYYQMKKNNITESIPPPITTLVSAYQASCSKANLMGTNITSYEDIKGQIKVLRDVPKKWHVPSTFSLEFISYFLDRNLRLTDLKNQLKYFTDQNNKFQHEQTIAQEKYNQVFNNNDIQKQKYLELRNTIIAYHNVIHFGNPNANIPDVESIARECQKNFPCTINNSVLTLAAKKSGIGFSMRHNDDNSRIIDNEPSLSLSNKCGICGLTNDQHLLAECDTCYLYYHLGCLKPPLTRIPKKTKLFRWQCSECDNSNSNSEPETVVINATRKRYKGKEQSLSDGHRSFEYVKNLQDFNSLSDNHKLPSASKKKKYQQGGLEEDWWYSPKIILKRVDYHKHKHYRENNTLESESTSDLITELPQHGIFIKSVPSASGVKTMSSKLLIGTTLKETPQTPVKPKPKKNVETRRITTTLTDIKLIPKCNTCKTTGTSSTMVQCSECSEYFHFFCLDPPLKKSPIVRGYSWHCAECNPIDNDTS